MFFEKIGEFNQNLCRKTSSSFQLYTWFWTK